MFFNCKTVNCVSLLSNLLVDAWHSQHSTVFCYCDKLECTVLIKPSYKPNSIHLLLSPPADKVASKASCKVVVSRTGCFVSVKHK